MKAYTDVEQSKALAKILPIDTADCCYIEYCTSDNIELRYEGQPPMFLGDIPITEIEVEHIPCWSLAALLEQLDDEIIDENGNDYNLTIVKENLQYQLYYHDSWGQVEDIKTDYYDDLVDACYEMIVLLHKENLI